MTETRKDAVWRRAWPVLALVAALLGMALQPPAARADMPRGPQGTPVADINHGIDRNAVKPAAPAHLKASPQRWLGANPGPLPVALPLLPACAERAIHGACRYPRFYAGIHALRSTSIVAQPRAPPISRT